MRFVGGFGGWLRASDVPELPPGSAVYTRVDRDEATGRLVPVEIYIETADGERLRGEHLRRVPLDEIESFANVHREIIEERLGVPGPDLSTLASHLMNRYDLMHTPGGPQPTGPRQNPEERDWIHDAFWAQISGSGVPRPMVPLDELDRLVMPRPERPQHRLAPPSDGRYSEKWYRELAAAYDYAVHEWREGHGKPPAIALAAEAGVSVNTVRSWIYRTRKAGFIPPGRQGQAG